jgi:tetratricopeptide (TPR) repeat protein
MFLSCQRVQLAFERGGLDRWERPLRVALNRHPESRWFLRAWQGLAYCESGRDDDARTIFDELAAKDFADLAYEPTWLYVVGNCAAVCAHLGDQDHAGALLELLRPYAGQFVTMSSLAYSGPVTHYLGMLFAALGQRDEALAAYEASAVTSAHMGAPTWLARTRLEWGRCLLDAGEPAAAGALLEQARATSAALGMDAVERRADALLDRLQLA